MNTQLTQSLLALSALVAIASITNGVFYCLFRFIELKSKFLSIFIIISALFLLIFDNPIYLQSVLFKPKFIFFSSLLIFFLAGIIHKRSGGGSFNYFDSILMMSITSILASLIAIRFPIYVAPIFPLEWLEFQSFFINTLLTAQILTPPFLFLLVKNSRLRPGIDKHFDE